MVTEDEDEFEELVVDPGWPPRPGSIMALKLAEGRAQAEAMLSGKKLPKPPSLSAAECLDLLLRQTDAASRPKGLTEARSVALRAAHAAGKRIKFDDARAAARAWINLSWDQAATGNRGATIGHNGGPPLEGQRSLIASNTGIALPADFEFKITKSTYPPPPDVIREAKLKAKLKDRERLDRLSRKPKRRGERVPLDVALRRTLRGPKSARPIDGEYGNWGGGSNVPDPRWNNNPANIKLGQEGGAAISILNGLGRWYVDAVTPEDLQAVIDTSRAEGLSDAAIRYRLGCLARIGVKGAPRIRQRAARKLKNKAIVSD